MSDAATGARVELALIGDDRRALGVSLLRADALAQRLGAESRASRSRAIVVAGRQVADALNALLMLFADPEADARIRFDGLARGLTATLTDLEGPIGGGSAPGAAAVPRGLACRPAPAG